MDYRTFANQYYFPLYKRGVCNPQREMSYFNRIVFPVIGDLDLEIIQPCHTSTVLKKTYETYSYDQLIAHKYNLMRNSFRLAISMELIHRNPCIFYFASDTKKLFVYPENKETHDLIVSSIERLRCGNIFGFCYASSFSFAELRSLHLSDYDAQNRLLTLHTNKHNGRYYISDFALSYLEPELEKHQKIRSSPDSFLFITDDGAPLPYCQINACSRVLKNLLGMPDFTTRKLWLGYGNMLHLTGGDIWYDNNI